MKLSSKETVRIKKIAAIAFLPVVMFYMTSLNLLLLTPAQAETEEAQQEEVVQEDSEGEEAAEEEETKEVEEEKNVEEAEEGDTQNETEEASKEENNNEDATEETDLEKADSSTEEEEVVPTDVSTEEGANDSFEQEKIEWKEDGDKWTIGPVELDEEYVAPQNKDVTVTFTKLPENPGNLTIEEITLADEQIEELGALSDKAYDITSNMKDGTFEYDLTLPKPDNVDEVQVKYAEDEDELDEAKTVEKTDIKSDSVKAKDLDHFTIFVVTKDAVTDCPGGVYAAGVCYDTIQDAIDAASSGTDTIEVFDGTYDETLLVNKDNLTIQAASGENPVIKTVTATSSNNRLIDIRGNNVTFEGFEIDGDGKSYVGISISGQDVHVEDNKIKNLLTGIQTTTQNSEGRAEIIDNEISDSSVGVSLQNEDNTVQNNTFSDITTEGMGVIYTIASDISGNTFEGMGGVNLKDYSSGSGLDLSSIVANNTFERLVTVEDAGGNILLKTLFASIKDAVDASSSGNIIKVAKGTYGEEKITFDKDLTVEGEGKNDVIIKPTQDTSGSTHNDSSGWFLVNSGITFNLSGVTLDGDGKSILVGIYSHGHGVISDNIIKNISYGSTYLGLGIELYGSDMTISGNEFSNIKRIGVFNGNGTDSIIEDNVYVGKGDGDWLDYGFEVGRESEAIIRNNEVYNNSGVALSDGSTSAGILVTSYYGSGASEATISNNNIHDCSYGITLGYLHDDVSMVSLDGNEFSDNDTDIRNYTVNDVDAKSTVSWSVADQGDIDQVESVIDHNCDGSPYTHGTCNVDDYTSGGSVDYWELIAPTLIAPANNSFVQGASLTSSWSAVSGAAKYIYESYHDSSATNLRWHAEYSGTSKTATNVSDAVFWWRVKAVDAANNEGPWSDLWKVTVDNQAPDAPIIEFPNPEQYFNTTPILNNWSDVSDSSGIMKYRIEYEYDDHHTFSGYPYRETTVSQRNHTPASWEQGGVSFRVQAFDNAGNEGAWSEWRHYFYDTSAPAVPTGLRRIAPNEGNKVYECGAISKIQKMWPDWDDNTEADFDHYEYSSFNPGSQGIDEQVFYDSIFEYNGNWLPGEGTYGFAVRAVDHAGNKSDWALSGESLAGSCQITYDSTAPFVEITSPTGSLLSGPVEVRGTVTDAHPHHYWLQIKKNGSVISSSVVNESNSFTDRLLKTLTDEGEYEVTLAARDAAGGTSSSGNRSADVVKSFTIDNTAPVVEISSPLDGETVNGMINITGSISDNIELSHYNLSLYPGNVDLSDGDTHSSTRLNDTRWCTNPTSGTIYGGSDVAGNLCSDWDTNQYGDGEYQIRLAARDAAGNRDLSDPYNGGTSSVHVVRITIDNTAPTITFDEPITDSVHNGTVHLKATCNEDCDYVNFWWRAEGESFDSASKRYHYVHTNGTNFEWDLDTLNAEKADGSHYVMPDGTYYLYAAGKDLVGNWARTPGEVKIIVDNTAPTSTIDGGSDGEVVYENSWDGYISGTASDGLSGVAGVKVSIQRGNGDYWNGSTWISSGTEILNDASGTTVWNYSIGSQSEDTYTIKSHAVDNAGNQENTYTLTIIFDKTIPTVDLSIDPSSPDGDNDWYVSKPDITLTAADNTKLDKIEYQLDSKSGTWKTYSSPVEISDGKHVFYYRSLDKAGNYSDIGAKKVKVDTQNPDPVKDLEAEYKEDTNTVKLTWDAEDDVNKVYIYRGKSRGFNLNSSSRLKKQDAGDDDYSDDDVSLGEKYYYKLTTYDEAGNRSDKVKVISIEITEEGEAIVVQEGIETVSNEGEIAGAQTGEGNENGQGEEMGEENGETKGAEVEFCQGWPFWVWLLSLIIFLILFVTSLFSRMKQDIKKGKLRWICPLVLAIVAFIFWYFFDTCREYIWFLIISLAGGALIYFVYLYIFRNNIEDSPKDIK